MSGRIEVSDIESQSHGLRFSFFYMEESGPVPVPPPRSQSHGLRFSFFYPKVWGGNLEETCIYDLNGRSSAIFDQQRRFQGLATHQRMFASRCFLLIVNRSGRISSPCRRNVRCTCGSTISSGPHPFRATRPTHHCSSRMCRSSCNTRGSIQDMPK